MTEPDRVSQWFQALSFEGLGLTGRQAEALIGVGRRVICRWISNVNLPRLIRSEFEIPNDESNFDRSDLTKQQWADGKRSGHSRKMEKAWADGRFEGRQAKIRAHWADPSSGYNTEENRKRMSDAVIQAWIDGRMSHSNIVSPTSIELLLREALTRYGVPFQTDRLVLGSYPDMFIEPNLCVYCDGDYWHNRPKRIKSDARITKRLIEGGYTVLRFWEHEIKRSPDWCVYEIQFNILENPSVVIAEAPPHAGVGMI